MKPFFYIGLTFFILLLDACKKEDVGQLQPISMTNHYEIQPSKTDLIQNKRYEIYEKYNVPVYFNDTIARIYLQQSIANDSVFVYETLDLAWRFNGYSDDSFKFEYQTDINKQMRSLMFINSFLSLTSKPLRPFSILITDSIITTAKLSADKYTENDDEGNVVFDETVRYFSGTRTLLFSGISDLNVKKEILEKATHNVVKTMVKDRILNYKYELNPFYSVTDKNLYNKYWNKIDSNIEPGFGTFILTESGENYYLNVAGDDDKLTPQELETEQIKVRSVIGKYGFIRGDNSASYFSPKNADDDLEIFIQEMLRVSKTTFTEHWGDYPLVMKKYNIIYKVIEEKLEFQL